MSVLQFLRLPTPGDAASISARAAYLLRCANHALNEANEGCRDPREIGDFAWDIIALLNQFEESFGSVEERTIVLARDTALKASNIVVNKPFDDSSFSLYES